MLTEGQAIILSLSGFLSLKFQAWLILNKEEVQGATHKKKITSKYLPCAFLDVSRQAGEREFKEHTGHVTQASSLSCPPRGRSQRL